MWSDYVRNQMADWSRNLKQPTHLPEGILVGVQLTDLHLNFSSFDEIPEEGIPYWIGLSENQAGPEFGFHGVLVVYSISSAEIQKSIKGTAPSELYTKGGGSDCELEAWSKKRKATQAATAQWNGPSVRVMSEFPCSSKKSAPPKVLSTDGK